MVAPSRGEGRRGNHTTYDGMWRRFGCLGGSSGGEAGVQQGRQAARADFVFFAFWGLDSGVMVAWKDSQSITCLLPLVSRTCARSVGCLV